VLIPAGFAQTAPAQTTGSAPAPPLSFDQVVDRAIFQENTLLKILRGVHPVTETYIQDLGADADFGTIPKTDHYFLGKLDLTRGVTTDSFIPKSPVKTRAFDVFTHIFSVQYMPRGFAQMLLIDGAQFDRDHYDFEFVKREFLGDVRAWVINVAPKKSAGSGRFVGRIWVEDRQFNIIRFNGTYSHAHSGQFYMHFDSWRVNCGPDLWVPFESYSEESDLPVVLGTRKLRFKALTRIWGFTTEADRKEGEFTNLTVDLPSVKDSSEQAADNGPVDSRRAWEREGEDNVLDRLERANLLAPAGEVEKILDTVVSNLVVTNNLNIQPEVRARVLLTTPLESFTVGHTIVISRGLLDTLPDEASLAAILAHELAHIALGQDIDTKFAFSDNVLFNDDAVLQKFRFARTQQAENAANDKAIQLLQNSPYKDKLNQAGLFLKALGAESERLPALIKPLFGSRLAEGNNVLRLSDLMARAPQLQTTRTDQIAALPLGARTSLDPWSNRLRMLKIRPVPLLSAREKMPFELTPIFLNLKYESATEAQSQGNLQIEPSGPEPTREAARQVVR
jgi:hypothetical protein